MIPYSQPVTNQSAGGIFFAGCAECGGGPVICCATLYNFVSKKNNVLSLGLL
ncbi:hypothetical protein BN1221_02445 [Brenneria goodwinii]|uniref:Uncharacterized protein n=1 Tax=Brenneria goodwinii TaxID=1109412 RepID=A0A0G4JVM4_9GAMM|nr:hypothetical protein BN1221_02445 [Brenneria goodwinii]